METEGGKLRDFLAFHHRGSGRRFAQGRVLGSTFTVRVSPALRWGFSHGGFPLIPPSRFVSWMSGRTGGDAQRPVAPAAKAPPPPCCSRAQERPARSRRRTRRDPANTPGRGQGWGIPGDKRPAHAASVGRDESPAARRPRFISPRRSPSPLGPGAARRDRSRAPLRPWRQDPPQHEPRLSPQARRQQLKAAVTAGRGGSGRSDTHTPRRGAALRPAATLALCLSSLFPPSRNQQGFQNGGFSGGEEEAGRRRPISARVDAVRGGQGRVRVTAARPRWRQAARGGVRALPLRGGGDVCERCVVAFSLLKAAPSVVVAA